VLNNKKKISQAASVMKRSGGASTAGTDSRQEKKRARKERELAKKHGEVLVEAKLVWNKVREKSRSKESRATLVARLVELLRGKMMDVADRHDAARVMQAIIQYGTAEQCALVAKELKGKICELSKKPHARFVVMRLLKHASKPLRAKLLKEFDGQAVALGTNARAALVLEFAYDKVLTSTEAAYMLQEFYGNEFRVAVFKRAASVAAIGPVVDSIWAEEKAKRGKPGSITAAERQAAIADALKRSITRHASKGLLTLAFVHQLLSDYFDAAVTAPRIGSDDATTRAAAGVDVRDAGCAAAVADIMPLVREICPGLLSTRLGLRCVLALITGGGAKDRKVIVRQMKESLLDLCRHPFAVMAVVQLVDIVDDTVLVRNTLLKPIVADDETLWNFVSDRHARMPLLALLASFDDPAEDTPGAAAGTSATSNSSRNSYFTQQERAALATPAMIAACSKKPYVKRRTELLAFLRAPLLEFACANAAAMLCNEFASDVLVEIARTWPTAELHAALADAAFGAPPSAEEAVEAVAEEEEEGGESAAAAATAEADAEERFAVAHEHPSAHITLQRILRASSSSSSESAEVATDALAVVMLRALGKDDGGVLACATQSSRGAFLVCSLLKHPHADCAAASKALEPHKAAIKAAAGAGGAALATLLK
jgi:pumilio family protein 6